MLTARISNAVLGLASATAMAFGFGTGWFVAGVLGAAVFAIVFGLLAKLREDPKRQLNIPDGPPYVIGRDIHLGPQTVWRPADEEDESPYRPVWGNEIGAPE